MFNDKFDLRISDSGKYLMSTDMDDYNEISLDEFRFYLNEVLRAARGDA